MSKTTLFLLFVASLFVVTCTNEDSSGSGALSERFFSVGSSDRYLQGIVSSLKQKNDSANFVSEFVETYGYPLWKDAVVFPENGNTVYAVPVKSLNFGAEIEAIWFFSIGAECTNYHIYTRKVADAITRQVGGDGVEDTWMFDYFTRYALHKEPASGLIFLSEKQIKTRSQVMDLNCKVTGIVGMEYEEVELLVIDVYCWKTYHYSIMFDGGGGGADGTFPLGEGGGGGSGSSSNGSISAKSSLDSNGQHQWEQIILEKKQECGYNAMLNYLSRNNYKLTDIKINSSISGSGRYNPDTDVMEFKSNALISNGFNEEFIHFFQNKYYSNGIKEYAKGKGTPNIEFEAKLLVDILCALKGDAACQQFGAGEGTKYVEQYTLWLAGITDDYQRMPSYDDLLKRDSSWGNLNYWDFMQNFAESSPSYNYPVDQSLEPSVLKYVYNNGCNKQKTLKV